MSEKDGGPAFPGKSMGFVGIGPFGEATAQYGETPGMTLRDWFAGQALVGMSSLYTQAGGTSEEIASANAAVAYLMADAMLAERAKN